MGALCTASVMRCDPPEVVGPAGRAGSAAPVQVRIGSGLFPAAGDCPGEHPDGIVVPAWKALPCVRTEPDPHRRRRARRTPRRLRATTCSSTSPTEPATPASTRSARSPPSSSPAARPGADTFIDLVAETRALRHAQRRRARRQRLHRGRRPAAARPRRDEHARGHRRLPVLQQRRGPAPLRGPGGRAGLPLHAVRAGRRQAHVRLLRPARPQGHRSPLHVVAPVRLAGRLQHRRPHDRGRPRRLPARRTSSRPSASRPTSSRSSPAPTPRSPTPTRASRSGSTAARRWPSTSTPTSSSASPSRASTSTTGSSTTRTRSTSTTSSSCPSSTPGRWRTPAR